MIRKLFAAAVALSLAFAAPVFAGDPLPATTTPSTVFAPSGGANPNSTGYFAARTPNVYKFFSGLNVSAVTTLWQPSLTSVRFRLMGYCVTQTGVAGNLSLYDNGVQFFVIPTNTLGQVQCSSVPGNGYMSTADGNLLSIVGANSEYVSGYFYGDEEQ